MSDISQIKLPDNNIHNLVALGLKESIKTTGNKIPYLFRPTNGGYVSPIGDRETDKLVGGTVAFNQLVKIKTTTAQGISASIDANGVIEFSGTSTGGYSQIFEPYQPIVGHKYFVSSAYVANPSEFTDLYFAPFNASSTPAFSANKIGTSYIANCTNSTGSGFGISGFVANTDMTGTKIKAQFIDLTQMFGSTIADYVYSLEQGTAGAGVAWFRNLFPKPYYAYNAGQLMSVKTSKHITTGFNQWDEVAEVGGIDGSGVPYETNNRYRSKNFIRILPDTNYYFFKNNNDVYGLRFYDLSENFIGSANVENSRVFTTPSNAYLMKFVDTTTATYNHDICINLSWDGERDGEYEAYNAHTYALDSSLTLRGIPKLDANNKLYYDGDVYESDGKVTRRYGELTNQTASVGATITLTGAKSNLSDIVTSKGHLADVGTISGTTLTLTKALSGDTIVYELATPTEESADSFASPMIVDDFGTEEFVDYPVSQNTRDVAIPVGHTTNYAPNLRAKLEMAPDSPDSDGDFFVRQTSGENTYVAVGSNSTISGLVSRVPVNSGADGTYTLKCTISGGVATYSWVADS